MNIYGQLSKPWDNYLNVKSDIFLDLSFLATGCRKEIQWDYEKGRTDKNAESWFGDMEHVVGVGYKKANIYDFVRFYKCANREPNKCSNIFWPHNRCSSPPCDKCLGKK